MSHGHSHGGGGHGHSHGGGASNDLSLRNPNGANNQLGPEQGVFDGYAIGDQNQTSRVPRYVYTVDPQVKRALYDAQRTTSSTSGKDGKKKKKKEDDHGHSHGGGGGGGENFLLESQPSEQYLEQYCYSGYLAHVILLHAQGVDVKRIKNENSDTEGATTVMWASLNGHLPVVRFLVDLGVDVNACTKDGQTALHWAVTEGHYDVVKFLTEKGADFTKVDSRGFDAYNTAIQQDNFPMLLFLHELRPMEPETTDADGHNYAHWCAYRNNAVALEFVHQTVKVQLDATDRVRRSPLHWAAREGALECIAYLLANGVSPTAPDADGTTPITHATARGHLTAATMLAKNDSRPVSYMTSTLSLMSTFRGMLLVIGGFMLPLSFFVAGMFLPIAIFFFLPSMISVKNVLIHAGSRKATRATLHYSGKVLTEIPADPMVAIRGTWLTRRREPFFIAFLTSLVLFEFAACSLANIPLPAGIEAFVAVTVLFALLAKRNAYGGVVQAKSLAHSDLVKAVKEGRTELLNGRQMDIDRHARLPIRAGYCVEVDRFFRRFDSWSLMLDCPISAVNHHLVFYFMLCFGAMQLYFGIHGLVYIYGYCQGVASKPFWGFDSEGILATLAYLVTGGLTCRDPAVDPETFYGKYRPSAMNAAAPFAWLIPTMLGFGTLVLVYQMLQKAAANITRHEQIHPFAMSTNGKIASIMRGGSCGANGKAPKGGETIYGSGSAVANVLMFLLGRQRSYLNNDEYEIPAPAAGTKLFGPMSLSSGGCCGGH